VADAEVHGELVVRWLVIVILLVILIELEVFKPIRITSTITSVSLEIASKLGCHSERSEESSLIFASRPQVKAQLDSSLRSE
jgi:hypothetical protein